MRVLQVIASINPRDGGPIEGVTQQAKYGACSGIATTVVSLDAPGQFEPHGGQFRHIALGREPARPGSTGRSILPWVRYGYSSRLIPWLKDHAGDFDVVVVNGLWNFSTYASRRALVGCRTPYVVFTHGMLDPWFKRSYPLKALAKNLFWRFCEGPLLRHADSVFFTTEEEKILARQSFRPYRVRERVVGYGTGDIPGDAERQTEAFRSLLPQLGNRRFLLFLSRIHPKKGCDLLIDAFAEVARANPDLDLVMAGPDQTGWSKALKARARMLGLESRIYWPGMVTGDAKWGAFRASEAFILPSHQENFGIVVAEAMAAAKPVLITDKVNIWREIEDSGSGLVEPDTPEGIRCLLRSFLGRSAEERETMGRKARAAFLARFEMTKAMAALRQNLETVIAERRESGRPLPAQR